jgi:hypothetical protein
LQLKKVSTWLVRGICAPPPPPTHLRRKGGRGDRVRMGTYYTEGVTVRE